MPSGPTPLVKPRCVSFVRRMKNVSAAAAVLDRVFISKEHRAGGEHWRVLGENRKPKWSQRSCGIGNPFCSSRLISHEYAKEELRVYFLGRNADYGLRAFSLARRSVLKTRILSKMSVGRSVFLNLGGFLPTGTRSRKAASKRSLVA